MAEHNDLGKKAENFAAEYLSQKGYQIIARNYRFQKAEIDIIAETTDKIIIVEVKARSSDTFLEPYEAVTKQKMRYIISATNYFLENYPTEKEVRFDIISILLDKEKKMNIQHLENAFDVLDAN